MFIHNFKYSLKVLLKNKILIFWTVAWPLLLCTMFNLAFSNISDTEKLSTIKLGIVNNAEYKNDEIIKNTFKKLGNSKSKDYMFDITYGNKDKIDKLLEDKLIDGYIIKNTKTNIVVKENGINQTIIKYVVDEIYDYQSLATLVIENNVNNELNNNNMPDTTKIYNDVMNEINTNKTYLNDLSKNNMDYSVIEFYTLISMTCLFGSLLTSNVISNYLANINKKGARITLAPVSRLKLLLGGLLASFIVQLFSIGLLLFYTAVVLKIDYGTNFELVILLSIIGSLAGNSLGLLVGAMTFKSDNSRTGIVMSITMLGCFFSGMMGITMKYIVDKNFPLLNKINPANMITDGFYSLYYYDTFNRFYFNIISLLIFSLVLIIISCFLMRRKKYDSI